MASRSLRSEFAGEDGRSGLPLKPSSACSASEKLRLTYTTGTEDPDAAPDNGRAFRGVGQFDPVLPPSKIPPVYGE